MRSAYVIFASEKNWSVARVTDHACEIALIEDAIGINAEAAVLAARSLKKMEYRGQNVLLALPSRLCMCAPVDEAGLRPRSRLATLRFRLEEQFPLALEEFVADFIPGNGTSLGVAIEVEVIEPILRAFEEEQIDIISLCPVALLIAKAVCARQDDDAIDAVLCVTDGHLNWIELARGSVQNWAFLAMSVAAIDMQLRFAFLKRRSLRLCAIGLNADLQNHLAQFPGVALIQPPDGAALQFAVQATGKVLLSGDRLPVELRAGQLASPHPLRQVRRPLSAAIAATALLAILFIVSMLWRSMQYDHLTELAHNQQLTAFREALPNQTPPPGITSRMISEAKRLRALSGTATALPPSASILPLLHDTLAALPANMRFRLLELQFEPQRLYLEGQTLDHAAADEIAAAIRHIAGLNVDPPHTEQPSGEDVTFTISASLASSSGSAPVLAAGKETEGQ